MFETPVGRAPVSRPSIHLSFSDERRQSGPEAAQQTSNEGQSMASSPTEDVALLGSGSEVRGRKRHLSQVEMSPISLRASKGCVRMLGSGSHSGLTTEIQGLSLKLFVADGEGEEEEEESNTGCHRNRLSDADSLDSSLSVEDMESIRAKSFEGVVSEGSKDVGMVGSEGGSIRDSCYGSGSRMSGGGAEGGSSSFCQDHGDSSLSGLDLDTSRSSAADPAEKEGVKVRRSSGKKNVSFDLDVSMDCKSEASDVKMPGDVSESCHDDDGLSQKGQVEPSPLGDGRSQSLVSNQSESSMKSCDLQERSALSELTNFSPGDTTRLNIKPVSVVEIIFYC